MVEQTDVFVIGGGPAGLAAAIAARKKGFRVKVADGSRWPIDKACGEGLMPDTIEALGALGVTVGASEGFPVHGVRFLSRHAEVSAKFPAGRGMGLRRTALHEKLVERALACGVSLLWNSPVVSISTEGVTMARGTHENKHIAEFVQAKWIIGADGIGSRVRMWAKLDATTRRACRYAVRRHYRMAPWSEFAEVHWGDGAQAYVTPVSDEEVCVVLISRERGAGPPSLEARFPRLAQRLKSAVLIGSDRGAITMMQKLEQVYHDRVALIGDASGSVDAITAEGLSLGFRQALALADALEADDLLKYQKAHRRLARRPELMGRLMLLLDGHSALRERTFRAFASDSRVFARLLAVHVGAKSQAHLAATGALLGWRFVAA
jgi:flavin-dependent dehydrogenase